MKDAGLRRDFELTSVKMRAMEMILSRPGADIAKARPPTCDAHLLLSHPFLGIAAVHARGGSGLAHQRAGGHAQHRCVAHPGCADGAHDVAHRRPCHHGWRLPAPRFGRRRLAGHKQPAAVLCGSLPGALCGLARANMQNTGARLTACQTHRALASCSSTTKSTQLPKSTRKSSRCVSAAVAAHIWRRSVSEHVGGRTSLTIERWKSCWRSLRRQRRQF